MVVAPLDRTSVRRCPRLTYLDIKIRQSKVKLVEGKKTFGLSISKLKELEGMGVDEVFISDDSTLQQINQCCPNFKQLKVYVHEDDDLLSKNTISLITTYFPKLKELDLPRSRLHRQDVLLILNACTELEILDITCNGKICVKDEILKIGSRLKKFYWDNEVQDVCYDCEGEHLEVDVEETYSYRWPCPHVVEEGFETYIGGTKEFLRNLYPNLGGTFGELVGNLYPDAKGTFRYPPPLFNPFVLESYDLPIDEYHEHYDCYCNCGFSSDSDGGTGDAAFITEAYSL
ncbi:hypothetical protein FRX31_022604 [Thalictrum thalictroides]|uniref:F-box/LRR-repeat protein n=1 Tax=Thalictrum thalictroides TaxID=46969 RepID=A0A7J6VRV2_THATH|nr:hypothetical protein FRX31_022604 [Thalictrum thalictroides]